MHRLVLDAPLRQTRPDLRFAWCRCRWSGWACHGPACFISAGASRAWRQASPCLPLACPPRYGPGLALDLQLTPAADQRRDPLGLNPAHACLPRLPSLAWLAGFLPDVPEDDRPSGPVAAGRPADDRPADLYEGAGAGGGSARPALARTPCPCQARYLLLVLLFPPGQPWRLRSESWAHRGGLATAPRVWRATLPQCHALPRFRLYSAKTVNDRHVGVLRCWGACCFAGLRRPAQA